MLLHIRDRDRMAMTASLGGRLAAVHVVHAEEAVMELYVGGDLSRKRLDWLAVWPDGVECGQGRSVRGGCGT
jgi:hypothetical protein